MAYGAFSHRFLQFVALGVLMLSMTQAQAQETATTDSPDLLTEPSEQTTLVTDPTLGETTTEIPATVDVVPAIETENRNAAFDLSAAADVDSNESNLSNGRCASGAVGFEIVTG